MSQQQFGDQSVSYQHVRCEYNCRVQWRGKKVWEITGLLFNGKYL